MTIEIIEAEGETPAVATTEAAAAVALAEVAVVAIEATAERVDELAQARAALAARDQELLDLRASIDIRFAELEQRVADAQFTAAAAVEAVVEEIDEEEIEEEEIEEEIEDAIENENEDVAVVLAGEEVVAVAPLIEAENPPVLHQEALTTAAKKKRGFIRI